MNDELKTAINAIREWRKDPVKFVIDNFKVFPDKWQVRALVAFADSERKIFRLSLQACAGPGKSALLAWCGLWFLTTQGEKGSHPKGAVVSVTQDNLKDNLWAEFAKWMNVSKTLVLLFTWTKSRIFAKDHPETWFLSARSFNKSANAEEQGRSLSGVHSKYVLFLIDESGDIPVQVLKAAEQALSTADKKFGRIVQAGNPTSTDGMLYAAQTLFAEKWEVIKITGDPEDPMRSPRIDIDWAADQIEQYGRNDPWVMSYILGQFPETGINTLLSLNDVIKAMDRRTLIPSQYDFSQKRIGVDVARFGADSTILFPRQGLRGFNYIEMRNANTHDITARVLVAKKKWGSELEIVDGTGGFGSGVVDNLIQAGANPLEIHFSSKAIDARYYNKRAEMWFEMAEWVKRGGVLPSCPTLKKQLTAPTYSFKNGKLILEDKERIKKRLGFSPDHGDALALTFCQPDQPASNSVYNLINKHKREDSDFDPMRGI